MKPSIGKAALARGEVRLLRQQGQSRADRSFGSFPCWEIDRAVR
jgi:hypothetical protein